MCVSLFSIRYSRQQARFVQAQQPETRPTYKNHIDISLAFQHLNANIMKAPFCETPCSNFHFLLYIWATMWMDGVFLRLSTSYLKSFWTCFPKNTYLYAVGVVSNVNWIDNMVVVSSDSCFGKSISATLVTNVWYFSFKCSRLCIL